MSFDSKDDKIKQVRKLWSDFYCAARKLHGCKVAIDTGNEFSHPVLIENCTLSITAELT